MYEAAERRADRSIDQDFIAATIVTRMPHVNYAQVFNTLVRWTRFGGFVEYDAEARRISLATEALDR